MRYPVTYCKSVLIKCQFYIVNFTNKSRLTLFFGQKEKKAQKRKGFIPQFRTQPTIHSDPFCSRRRRKQCSFWVPPVFPIKISSFNVISNYNLIKHATFLNWRDGADSNFREYLSIWLCITKCIQMVLVFLFTHLSRKFKK